MAKVKMVASVTGTRPGKRDGERVEWPKPGDELECEQWEADELVAAGLAMKPGAEDENALADVLPVEAATRTRSSKGNKAVNADARVAMKPAPHADEEDAYHVPPVAGEKAAAEAGQKAVDEANEELLGKEAVKQHKELRGEPK